MARTELWLPTVSKSTVGVSRRSLYYDMRGFILAPTPVPRHAWPPCPGPSCHPRLTGLKLFHALGPFMSPWPYKAQPVLLFSLPVVPLWPFLYTRTTSIHWAAGTLNLIMVTWFVSLFFLVFPWRKLDSLASKRSPATVFHSQPIFPHTHQAVNWPKTFKSVERYDELLVYPEGLEMPLAFPEHPMNSLEDPRRSFLRRPIDPIGLLESSTNSLEDPHGGSPLLSGKAKGSPLAFLERPLNSEGRGIPLAFLPRDLNRCRYDTGNQNTSHLVIVVMQGSTWFSVRKSLEIIYMFINKVA